jgi:hypothetical protein
VQFAGTACGKDWETRSGPPLYGQPSHVPRAEEPYRLALLYPLALDFIANSVHLRIYASGVQGAEWNSSRPHPLPATLLAI